MTVHPNTVNLTYTGLVLGYLGPAILFPGELPVAATLASSPELLQLAYPPEFRVIRVAGLTNGVSYQFSYRVHTKVGVTPWSAASAPVLVGERKHLFAIVAAVRIDLRLHSMLALIFPASIVATSAIR